MQGNKRIQFVFENFWNLVLSIPKTLYFNFAVLPFSKAIHLPFIVSWNIRLRGINKKTFVVQNPTLKFATQRIGFGGSAVGVAERKKGSLYVRNNGKVVIKGDIGLSRGITIDNDGGIISIGENFRMNYACTLSCDSKSDILIGDNVVCGWHVTIKNCDGHSIVENGVVSQNSKDIIIGDHVWICSNSDILKGVVIGNDSVVAYRSLVTKGLEKPNILYGGVPAKVIKEDINWLE